MRVVTRGGLLLLVLTGCGDDVASEMAPLGELCEAPEAHRLLELEADERLARLARVDERLYYVVGTGDGGDSDRSGYLDPLATTVYSTGPCGEDRRTIAEDVWRVFEHEAFPGLLLGCRGGLSGDLVVLDTSGETTPSLLVTDGCDATFSKRGLVRVDAAWGETGPLLFYPYPISGDTPIVLLDEVQAGWQVSPNPGDDELMALTPDGDLMRVSLPDGEVTLEQTAVRNFALSADRRFLAWQDLTVTVADPYKPGGKLILRDRVEGGDTVLAESGFPYSTPMIWGDLVQVWFDIHHPRVVVLPSLATLDFPEYTLVFGSVADGRRVIAGDFDGPFGLLDLGTGVITPITDTHGAASIGPDHLELRLANPFEWKAEGQFWRYPYDGGEPELLAERVSGRHFTLPDMRVMSALDIDADGLGTLVVVQPGTRFEQIVEYHADGLALYHDTAGFDPDVMVYGVVDGKRSGVWAARMTVE
jgi:hypothetical protein